MNSFLAIFILIAATNTFFILGDFLNKYERIKRVGIKAMIKFYFLLNCCYGLMLYFAYLIYEYFQNT